ncbi:family 16 glycosylhydrolase [Alteromonas macleodii]|uniref:family 16 glycosylhydrolase n=1 Tax=Alteromonas macleodii TaxID=28108 RepID=UPI002076B835|nr:family 16 glycosylhydrolase [Alteromonas macleodii]USI27209.1 family 16 glycosylhydrolase [Alteromonas macleodii]
MKTRIFKITSLSACLLSTGVYCSSSASPVLPLSDPMNKGGWVLNKEVSDEFDADKVDEDRWFIVGKFKDGKPQYVHPDDPDKWVWKGRAPSQFSGRNYRLEDGKLMLEARWEPDFPFTDEIRKPTFGEPMKHENITTPCFIGRRSFTYGYIEIKSKSADAEVTSAFWSMGPKMEFDFFESFGDSREDPNKDHLDSELWWSIRDWEKPVGGKPSYTERKQLGFRMADDFHVYGIEWSEDGINYYIDGELFSSMTPEQATAWAKQNREGLPDDYNGYVATRPINLWLDMETFPWHGYPNSLEDLEKNSPEDKKLDGVVDFEVEYIRVWQKLKHTINK